MPARTAVASSDNGCGDEKDDDKASASDTLVGPAMGMDASLEVDEDDEEDRRARACCDVLAGWALLAPRCWAKKWSGGTSKYSASS